MATTKTQSSKNKLLLLAALLLLILMLGGGVAYAVTTGKLDLQKLFEEPPPPPVVMSEKPIFKALDKFVVSLVQEKGQRYMMLELSLVSHDPRMPQQADQLNTVIRNALLQYFSSKGHSEIRAEVQDISGLQLTLRDKMTAAASAYGEELPIEEVLLTNVMFQ